jgi:hypothetical protein
MQSTVSPPGAGRRRPETQELRDCAQAFVVAFERAAPHVFARHDASTRVMVSKVVRHWKGALSAFEEWIQAAP